MDSKQQKKVIIVGGGLVGALNACFFAKRGYEVELHELRPDIRKQELKKGRSINLALSHRGREALAAVGLEETVTSNGIAMYARMIHDLDGTRRPIPYGRPDQYIISVERAWLNEVLITAAEEHENVSVFFEDKLTKLNCDEGECTFERGNSQDAVLINTKADLVLGNDGAYSTVRRQMMKEMRLDFSQNYIDHGYMELRIPPTQEGQFAMEINYLHIWARNTFMLIAVPNAKDNSFVLTLFMPFANFKSIKTKEELLKFFNDKFPDAVPLIGKEELVETFFRLKPLPLVTVKCHPYFKGDKVLIMGDAAHAMVPFYGQGMNGGFEDCLVLDSILDEYDDDLSKVLPAYSEYRHPDAVAICDLALYNYVEMRSSVNSRMFLLRKKLDNILFWMFPNSWVPLYTMVSFSRTRYHECISKRQWQDKLLNRVVSVVALGMAGVGAVLAVRMAQEKQWTSILPAFCDEGFNKVLANVKSIF